MFELLIASLKTSSIVLNKDQKVRSDFGLWNQLQKKRPGKCMVLWRLALSVAKGHLLLPPEWFVLTEHFSMALFPAFQSWLWSMLLGTEILQFILIGLFLWGSASGRPGPRVCSLLMRHFHWGPMIIHRTYFVLGIKLCNYSVAFWFSLKNIHKHSLIRTIPSSLEFFRSPDRCGEGKNTLTTAFLPHPVGVFPLVACVTLNELLTLTGSQFPYLLKKQLSPL